MSASVQLRLPSDVSSITAEQLYQHYGNDFCGRIDSVFTEDTGSGLSDRLRANVSRFAAYKAQYVETALKRALDDDKTPVEDREKLAKAVLRTFSRYQDAERSTATARARTAKQFEEFMQPDNVRLFPNLKWLPSRSADPRTSHQAFYNRVWAKDDPFWNTNAPGTEWNCKCDIEETDEPATDNAALPQPQVPLGLEGNPAQTGEVFTDNASYIRAYSRTRSTREDAEKICQRHAENSIRHLANDTGFVSKTSACLIDGNTQTIRIPDWGVRETAQSMFGNREYWLKNELLRNFAEYLNHADYIGSMPVDLTHNTGRTLRMKRQFRKYHYMKVDLGNGHRFCFQIVEHNNGNYYLYTITRNSPI